jgi:ABC-type transport system substrate-binding protein
MNFLSNANNTADADYNLALNISSKNRGFYWKREDDTVDQMIDEGRQILDPAEREGHYHDLVKKIVEAAPWIFLYVATDIYGVSNDLQGWKPRPDEMIYLYGASMKS